MASIPLPALSIRPPQQQQDPAEQYSRLLQLKQTMQEAPLRMQALQQAAQTGDIDLQQKQQAVKDQQAFRSAMSDPSLQGKTIGDVADYLAGKGQISQQGWMGAKKADIEHRQSLATLDKDQLDNAKKAHDATYQLYSNVMSMPDDQLASNWPQIAQQYDSIPGNAKMPLNPNQPMSKQQLAQFGPMISMSGAYLAEATDKQQKKASLAKTTADAQLAEINAERGGTTDLDKYTSDYLKSHSLENTPANRQTAFHAYTKETKIEPAQVRAQVMLQTPTQVFDPATGQTVYATRKDAIGKVAPNSAEAIGAKAGVQADAASLKKLQESYDAVSAFENTANKNIDMLKGIAAKVPDLGSKFANVPVRMFSSSMIGAENMAAFKTALAPVQTEAAKILNSANLSGSLSDSSRHELQEIIDGNMPYKSLVASLNVLQQDFKNRHQSYQQQLQEIQGRIKGNAGNQSPTAQPVGTTNKPDGVYEMNGKHFKVQSGKVYAAD